MVKSILPNQRCENKAVSEHLNNLFKEFFVLKGPKHLIKAETILIIFEVFSQQELKYLLLVIRQFQKVLESFAPVYCQFSNHLQLMRESECLNFSVNAYISWEMSPIAFLREIEVE